MTQRRNAEMLKEFLQLSGRDFDWLHQIDAAKFESDGYIPLGLDVLHREPGRVRLALAHYTKHEFSGDMMADPDMEMILEHNGAEATLVAQTYQNDWVGVFNTIDSYDEGSPKRAQLQKSMDDFLSMWLGNLLAQGHRLV